MTQTTLTRAEAIEALLKEFTSSDEYEDGMADHHDDLLDGYLASDDYIQQVEEAKVVIVDSYLDSDEFDEAMAEESNSLIAAHRAYLESLSDEALAEEAGVVIVPEADADVDD